MLQEIDIGKKDVLNKILTKALNPRHIELRSRLDKLINFNNKIDNNFLPPPPPPPLLPEPPRRNDFFQPKTPFQPPPQTSRQNDFLSPAPTIPSAPSTPPLPPDDYFVLPDPPIISFPRTQNKSGSPSTKATLSENELIGGLEKVILKKRTRNS